MSPSRLLRAALLVALASASTLAYLPACSSNSEDPSNSLTAGVLRQGDPSDAAVTQLLSYEADDWGWAGGVFQAPPTDPTDSSIDVTLPANVPFTFVWHADPVPSPEAGAAGTLNAANGTGFTGVAFLLVFSTPSDPKLLRIVTTDSSFTPSAADWKKLTSSSEPVTFKLASGTFENDELTAEGGPHQGQELNLSFVGRRAP
jgi:hypothetical protein